MLAGNGRVTGRLTGVVWFGMAVAATTSLVALFPVSMRLLVHGIDYAVVRREEGKVGKIRGTIIWRGEGMWASQSCTGLSMKLEWPGNRGSSPVGVRKEVGSPTAEAERDCMTSSLFYLS